MRNEPNYNLSFSQEKIHLENDSKGVFIVFIII